MAGSAESRRVRGAAEPSPSDTRVASLWAVVPAAGRGSRMVRDRTSPMRPKQYLELAGRTLLERALDTLLAVSGLAGVVVALAPDDERWAGLEVSQDPRVHAVTGAATRASSVAAGLGGLRGLAPEDAWVLVHDAARPLVSLADITRLVEGVAAGTAIGGLLAVPVQDTLKRSDGGRRVAATVPRERLWQAQTPQLFRLGELARALGEALADADAALTITDEASAMERAGHVPQLVEALDPNPKITRAGDLATAAALLERRSETACA